MRLISNIKSIYNNPNLKAVGIYTFTNFFAKATSFLLLIVFTNPVYISPSEIGLLSLFSNSIIFLMPFLSMGIIHSAAAEFYKMDKAEYRDYFSTSFLMPLAVMIISCIILFLNWNFLESKFGFPLMFVWLIPLVTFLTFCLEQLLSLARNNNQPHIFLRANVTKILLELGISFVLVVYLAWRWQGRIAGILVASMFAGTYAIWYFIKFRYLFGVIKKKYILSELKYAIPLIAMQASIFCMSASDRFFLSHFTQDNNETVGIYSIAVTFGTVVIIFSSALLQYVFPKIYSTLSREIIDYNIIKRLFLKYALTMLVATLGLMLITPIVYKLFINHNYHPALSYQYLFCLGFLFWSIAYFFYSFLLYYKAKKNLLIISVLGIIISLCLNYFFIKNYGPWGGAIANAFTYLLIMSITLITTRRYWIKMISVNIN